jgi:CRP-like cAMP-binding protein
MDKGEPFKITADFVPKVFPKSQTMRDTLMGIVTTNILFSSYAAEEHSAIVDAFESKSLNAGTFVIRQGESGDNFYVVESGTLDIYVRNASGVEARVGNPLQPGSHFGELALMYNTPRAASIKANSDCVVWFIDRATYRSIVVYHKYLRNRQYMEFLRNVEIMNKKLGVVMTDGEFKILLVYVKYMVLTLFLLCS